MQNLMKEHNELLKKEEVIKFFSELDESIIEEMFKNDYSTELIAETVKEKSFILKNQPLEFVDAYLKEKIYLSEYNGQQIVVLSPNMQKADVFYQNAKDKQHLKIQSLFESADQTITKKLIEQKYSIKQVQEMLLKNSLFAHEIKSPKLICAYCDLLLQNQKQQKILDTAKNYEIAKKLYLQKSSAIKDKYSGYEEYNEYQEGKVVMSMMMEENISPEIVSEVLRKNSRNPKANEEYVEMIINACLFVKKAYQEIKQIKNREQKTHGDTYRAFAHTYMEKSGAILMNGKDDQNIVKMLFTQGGMDKKEISKALHEASPIAREVGRGKNKYIQVTLSAVEEYERKHAYNYAVTAALYDEKLAQKEQILKRENKYEQTYYDGIIVKEMLEEKQVPSNILRILEERNPQKAVSSSQEKKYGKWLLEKEHNVLKAESEILSYPSNDIPASASYNELKAIGFEIKDLYRAAIKERIETYPSTALNLNSEYIDKDACEKLLQRYPEIKNEELSKAIKEASPRAQMAGLSENYAEVVLDEVTERMKQLEEKQKRNDEIQKEYLRQCGLSGEGVEAEANMMTYHDGRAAVKMLMEGFLASEIYETITENAKAVGNEQPHEYAKEIILQAEKVKDRVEALNDLKQIDEAKTPDEFYQQKFKEIFSKKPVISSKVDITIAKEMMNARYDPAQIKDVIEEYSPVAIEPGRNEKYSEYVENWAKESIEHEKRKLNEYEPIPRMNPEETAEKEYLYQVEQLKKFINLPIDPEIDETIAKILIQEGFGEKEIAECLEKSVSSSSKKEYGKSIVASASKSLEETRSIITTKEKFKELSKEKNV